MTRKKLTVYDYLQCKGKRQLSVLFVHNVDEARAAEEAGIDMICTSHDAPQFGIYCSFDELKRIREAAPSCFMQSGTASNIASEYDAMKALLDHQDQQGNTSYKPLQHITTSETGKFTIRH